MSIGAYKQRVQSDNLVCIMLTEFSICLRDRLWIINYLDNWSVD